MRSHRADIHDGPDRILQSESEYMMQDRISQRRPKPLAPHGQTIHWVKTGKTPYEQMISAIPPTSDIRHGMLKV
jgi:hypothetical protein